MTRRGRLTPKTETGLMIVDASTVDGRATWLAHRASMIEDALIKIGAAPGIDYTYKDLMQWALSLEEPTPVSQAIIAAAKAIQNLGTGDAATRMGAIELLSMELKNGLELIAQAIEQAMSSD